MAGRAFPVLAVLALLGASPALAQPECVGWQGMSFAQGSGPHGANGAVQALTTWDPEGDGSPLLVAAGSFTQIQGVAANRVAVRDPATGRWQALGSGIPDGSVRALAVHNNQLIVGGTFSSAGGASSTSYIARWTGTAWQSLGSGIGDNVYALAIYNGELIAGGYFTHAGGVTAAHVARWNGSSWAPLGAGINDWVMSLAVWNGELIAGGFFSSAGGLSANRIARWNGASWAALGSGCNAEVLTLTVFPGGLAVGGRFTTAGGLAANRIARWNGSWGTLGTGADAVVLSTISYNGELYAGGAFFQMGGVNVAGIARWTGAAWTALGFGLIGAADALFPYDGELIVGGAFSEAGAAPAVNLASWNGLEWGSFGGGTSNGVFAMTTFLGWVVAGGDLHQSTLGPPAHFLVGWDGASFRAFGTSMDSPVYSLKAHKYPGVLGGNELIAGGTFLHAGGVAANRIARWNVTNILFDPPEWEAMGAGFSSGVVHAIERHSSTTYAGGTFTVPARIARWNETSDVWEALGTGMNGTVHALRSHGGFLYAGGSFTTAGGVSTGGLARWNGTGWSSAGGFFQGTGHGSRSTRASS